MKVFHVSHETLDTLEPREAMTIGANDEDVQKQFDFGPAVFFAPTLEAALQWVERLSFEKGMTGECSFSDAWNVYEAEVDDARKIDATQCVVFQSVSVEVIFAISGDTLRDLRDARWEGYKGAAHKFLSEKLQAIGIEV